MLLPASRREAERQASERLWHSEKRHFIRRSGFAPAKACLVSCLQNDEKAIQGRGTKYFFPRLKQCGTNFCKPGLIGRRPSRFAVRLRVRQG